MQWHSVHSQHSLSSSVAPQQTWKTVTCMKILGLDKLLRLHSQLQSMKRQVIHMDYHVIPQVCGHLLWPLFYKILYHEQYSMWLENAWVCLFVLVFVLCFLFGFFLFSRAVNLQHWAWWYFQKELELICLVCPLSLKLPSLSSSRKCLHGCLFRKVTLISNCFFNCTICGGAKDG